MPKIQSPRMDPRGFLAIVNALQAIDPVTHAPFMAVTNHVISDLMPYAEGNQITVDPLSISTNVDGVAFCDGRVLAPSGETVTGFALYWDEGEYTLRAALKGHSVIHAMDMEIRNTAPREAAVRAYAAFMRPDCFAAENSPDAGIPLYVARDVECTLGENGYARTDANKALMYGHIREAMAGFTPAQMNWLAFRHAMCFENNEFSAASSKAFAALQDNPAADIRYDDLPGECYDRDNFADPRFAWPPSNPDDDQGPEAGPQDPDDYEKEEIHLIAMFTGPTDAHKEIQRTVEAMFDHMDEIVQETGVTLPDGTVPDRTWIPAIFSPEAGMHGHVISCRQFEVIDGAFRCKINGLPPSVEWAGYMVLRGTSVNIQEFVHRFCDLTGAMCYLMRENVGYCTRDIIQEINPEGTAPDLDAFMNLLAADPYEHGWA